MGLDFVDLTMRIEKSFGVDVEPDDFSSGAAAPGGKVEYRATVGDLLAVILRKRQTLADRVRDGGLRELAVADVRQAVADVLGRPVETLDPEDRLETLVEKRRRRAVWRRLARRLGKRLPGLEWDGVSPRLVWWTSCLAFTAMAETVAIRLVDTQASLVSRIFAIVMVTVGCAFLPGVIAASFFVALPWWLRRRLPLHVVTVADLGVAVLGLNRDRYVQAHGDRGDADVWPSLRILIADVLGIPMERVTPEADLVRDLGMD